MKKIIFYLICIWFVGCTDIDKIKLANNPFDVDFEGEIIQVLQVEDRAPQNIESCSPSISFQFIPEVYNRMNEILGSNDMKLISIFFEINGDETKITDSDGNLARGGNAVYDPGISDLLFYDEFEKFRIEFPSILKVIDSSETFDLNVIFLIREKRNSNAANRKEYIKQIVKLQC